MRSRIAAALLAGAIAFSTGIGLAGESGDPLEQSAVETASTPAQHAALALHYRDLELKAQAEAKRHEIMARTYTGTKMTQRQRMNLHCNNLANQNKAMAAEYQALAELHESEGKQ